MTYALQDAEAKDDAPGPGNGAVDVFATDGSLRARLISGAELNAPWGIALSPTRFAAAPDRLLIGNFGDGKIHVYELDLSDSGHPRALLQGALQDGTRQDLVIDGLWALKFGTGEGGFGASELFYTAGPGDEMHGVFGRIAEQAPEHGPADAGPTGETGY